MDARLGLSVLDVNASKISHQYTDIQYAFKCYLTQSFTEWVKFDIKVNIVTLK